MLLNRNILIRNNVLKIADFGLAKVLQSKYTNSDIGTPAYMAPEIWGRKGYNFKSDVWYATIIRIKN